MTHSSVFDRMVSFVSALQDDICAALEACDTAATFTETAWDRPGGGGGRSRVLTDGKVFEKAGVNVSVVHGDLPDVLAESMPGTGRAFSATGISLVLHPRSPMLPTVHANYRRFDRDGAGWFGGGADLTPHYLYEEDAEHFHRVLADVCAAHPAVADYAEWKAAADEYFYLPHRHEHRGIGGIFFDYLQGDDEAALAFVTDAGRAFLDAYLPIVERRRNTPWGERERTHQLVRRGRYVEFNLVYDRGTVFGLKTDGNIESVLMSLPDPARWVYRYEPEPGSWEERSVSALRTPRDWLGSGRDTP